MSRFSIGLGISNSTWSQMTCTLNIPLSVSTFWSIPAGQDATMLEVMPNAGRHASAARQTVARTNSLIMATSPPARTETNSHADCSAVPNKHSPRSQIQRRALTTEDTEDADERQEQKANECKKLYLVHAPSELKLAADDHEQSHRLSPIHFSSFLFSSASSVVRVGLVLVVSRAAIQPSSTQPRNSAAARGAACSSGSH